MKNVWFILMFVSVAIFQSCQKESQQATDDLLSQQIAFSETKTAVAPAELPVEARNYVDENYFETYIESAFLVKDRGFEIILGTEDVLYCDMRGRVLRPDHPPFAHGPCGRGLPVGVDQLPAGITGYVADNYPDAQILRAKKMMSGMYFVKITNPELILIFKADGTFLEATVLFFHCRPLGLPIDIGTLPDAITDYIEANYAGAEIKVAFHKNNGMYVVGIFTADGQRKILGFDADGNLVFVRP
jgi:hypothetical protein